MEIIIVDNLHCPHCGAPEVHPTELQELEGKPHPIWLIRPFKVDAWCQCLVCAGAFTPKTYERTGKRADPEKGWFEYDLKC